MRAHLVDMASPAMIALLLAAGGYIYAFYHFHQMGWLARLVRRGLIRRWQPLCFALGIAVIGAALFSQIHDLAEEYLYWHMIQHVLLMVAPLLILFGLPSPVVRWLLIKANLKGVLAGLTHPLTAYLLFNINLLAWHIPTFYQATLTNELVHDFQHALFFYTSLFYYWRLVDPTHGWHPFWDWTPSRWLYLMVAAPPSYILGSVLWASSTVFYPHYAYAQYLRPPGLTALQDQSYAGLIMWLQGWMFVMASMFVFFLHYEPGLEQAQE